MMVGADLTTSHQVAGSDQARLAQRPLIVVDLLKIT
jgi:hypothetical protein